MNVRIDGVSLSDGHETPPPTPVYRIPQSQEMDGDTTHDQQPSSSRLSSPNSTLPQSSPSQPNEHSQAHDAEDKKGSKLLSRTKNRLLRTWDPNLILENSGSVARDHLASERTFLAYMRTSLTIASTGVALVQLFTLSAETNSKALERFSRPLGAVIIVIGFGVLLMGLVRYFMIQNALVGGTYPVARVGIILLSVVMAAITVVVFGVIVGVR